jgi:hypothetical protein
MKDDVYLDEMARKLAKRAASEQKNEDSSAYRPYRGAQFATAAPFDRAKRKWNWNPRPPPDLYTRPRQASGLDLSNLLRLFYSPEKALASLYASASLWSATILVILSGASVWLLCALFNNVDILGKIVYFVGGVVNFYFSMVIISVVASGISKFFYGRGSTSATFTLVGYCVPFIALWLCIFLVVVFVSDDAPWLLLLVIVMACGLGLLYSLALTGVAIAYANNLSVVTSSVLLLIGLGVTWGLDKVVAVALNLVGINIGVGFIPLSF